MQKVEKNFKSLMETESSPPEEVAKVILKAVTSKYLQLRYAVGNDAVSMMQARMDMSDDQFKDTVMLNFLK